MPNTLVINPRADRPDHGIAGASASVETLNALTSLRFFAAMMIAVLHSAANFTRSAVDPCEHLALPQGVSFFFVLSGFILYYKYPGLETAGARFKFLVYRFARIWPAHLTVAILFMLTIPSSVWWLDGSHSIWVILSNITMTQAWLPQHKVFFSVNPASWSISCEFFFYLMFPLLILGWRKTWWIKLLGCAVMTLAVMSWFYLFGPKDASFSNRMFLLWLVYINPLVRIFEFMLGMATALLYRRFNTNKWTTSEITRLQMAAILFAVISIAVCSVPIKVHSAELSSPYVLWFIHCGGAPAYAFLIFAMAQSRGDCARALSHSLLIWLGEISYSIYLVHDWLVYVYIYHIAQSALFLPGWLCYGGYWLALMTISATIYSLVETPARKFLPKLILGFFKQNSVTVPVVALAAESAPSVSPEIPV